MNKTGRILILSTVLLLISVPIFSFDNMNRRIGIIYLKNAAANYLNGRYDNAESFLVKASEFYAESSDYEYLKGLIKLEKENKINDAVDNFKRAILFENWMLLEKKDCVTDLAQLMFRKKEYSDLIKIVEEEAYPDYRDNDLMYLYLLSLKNLGQTVKYKDNLKISINRYPDDYRFGALYIDESVRYAESVLNGNYDFKNSKGAIEVFLKAALGIEESKRKISALQEYFDMGGKDTQAFIEYYRLTGVMDEVLLDRMLETNFFEDPSNRQRLKQVLTSNELKRKLEEAYKSYTGNIYYDLNKDGYFEELHLYESGRPVGISIDNNQDGIIEVMIIFGKNQPSEVILSGTEFIRISYDKYPWVQDISISDGFENNIYTMLKEKLNLPVYEFRKSDDKLVFLKEETDNVLNNVDFIENISVKISTYYNNRKDNFKGLKHELERQDENFAILKIYNKILGNFIYQQLNNKRTTGFGDIDFDNLIDLKETYSDGELVSIEADDNKNGIYDYKLSFEEDLTISWWDFNEDGLYDCRQYEKNGVLVNEYSSAFDGNFDIIERK